MPIKSPGGVRLSSVLSFIKLDFYTIKPHAKSILWMPLLGIISSIVTKTTIYMTMYLVVMMMLVNMYPFTISEANQMGNLLGTLPLTRRDIVRGRYAFALVANILAFAITFAFSLMLSAIHRTEEGLTEIILTYSLIIPLLSIMPAFQYPLFFRRGQSRVKLIAAVPACLVMLLLILVLVISKLHVNGLSLGFLDTTISTSPALLLIPAVIVAIALMAVSYLISCKIYQRRDIDS